jgi:hypothetical protein
MWDAMFPGREETLVRNQYGTRGPELTQTDLRLGFQTR